MRLLHTAVFCAITGTALLAGDAYVGIEYGAAINTHKFEASGDIENTYYKDNDYKELKLKIGTGKDKKVKYQASFSVTSFDEGGFDEENEILYVLELEVIKGFSINKYLYPYIKAGIGIGTMKVSGYTNDDSINGTSLSLGVGMTYKINKKFNVNVGIDQAYRRWEDLNYAYIDISSIEVGTIKTVDKIIKPYVGLSYRY